MRIATGWGLDPVPTSCWIAGTVALLWPAAVGAIRIHRPDGRAPAGTADGTVESVDG